MTVRVDASVTRSVAAYDRAVSRPSPLAFFTNWRTYDAPFTEKVRLAFRNNAIKLRQRSDCCGNHGQPGC